MLDTIVFTSVLYLLLLSLITFSSPFFLLLPSFTLSAALMQVIGSGSHRLGSGGVEVPVSSLLVEGKQSFRKLRTFHL